MVNGKKEANSVHQTTILCFGGKVLLTSEVFLSFPLVVFLAGAFRERVWLPPPDPKRGLDIMPKMNYYRRK